MKLFPVADVHLHTYGRQAVPKDQENVNNQSSQELYAYALRNGRRMSVDMMRSEVEQFDRRFQLCTKAFRYLN